MTDKHAPRMDPPAPATMAPDFRIRTTPGQMVSPTILLGQPVGLAFYPANRCPVCSDQMLLYQELALEFKRHNSQVLGTSVDDVWCHVAFRARSIGFPPLANFEPKGAALAHHTCRKGDTYSERALLVLDPKGSVAWSCLSPVGANPGADGIRRALEELSRRKTA